ncbi:MAG: hypothetical protein IPM26_09350 [Saprospiraceae bacterium]|nr:hypothetical protein [Saprospiraceae bacterium]
MDKEKVKKVLQDANVEISEEEDISDEDNPDMQLIESEDAGLMIWFDEGEAIEIQLLPELDEDGEDIVWPE